MVGMSSTIRYCTIACLDLHKISMVLSSCGMNQGQMQRSSDAWVEWKLIKLGWVIVFLYHRWHCDNLWWSVHCRAEIASSNRISQVQVFNDSAQKRPNEPVNANNKNPLKCGSFHVWCWPRVILGQNPWHLRIAYNYIIAPQEVRICVWKAQHWG